MDRGRRFTIGQVLGVATVLALAAGCGSSSTKTSTAAKSATGAAKAKSGTSKTTGEDSTDSTEADSADDTQAAAGGNSARPEPFCTDYKDFLLKQVGLPFDDTGKQELKDLAKTVSKDAPPEIAAYAKTYAPAVAAVMTSSDDPTVLKKKAVAFAKDHAKEIAQVNGYYKRVCLGL